MDKRGRCRSIICAAFLMIFILAGVGLKETRADVALDKTTATVGVGKKVGFSILGTTKKVKWKSSDPTIAKVSKKGVVKGISSGNARITAMVGKKSFTAKVKVRTFLISDSKVDVTGDKTVTLTLLTDDGSIRSKVADSDICSVMLGDWIGDDLAVKVVPKKVGSTKVVFSNTMNNETCVLKVKVKSVPVVASIDEPVISTGARYFIPNENSMSVSFSLSGASNDCNVEIYSESGLLLKTIYVGSVQANTAVTVNWDGTDNAGNPFDGRYTVGVTATGVKERLEDYYRIMQASPFKGGDGSAENPFRFGTAAELSLIPQYDDEGIYFRQYADIDLNGNSEIGELFPTAAGLKGTVSGTVGAQRFSIANYMSSKPLFGYIGETGCVSGITLSDALISGGGATLAVHNYGVIENCVVDAAISITKTNNLKGGLIATTNYGSITGCDCSGDIRMTLSSLLSIVTARVGGVVAENNGQIYRCTAKVDMNVSISMSSTAESGSFAYVGGIAGENPEGAVISEATYNGKLTVNMGTDENSPTSYVGGVCGVNNGITSGCGFSCYDENIKEVGYGAGISS
ncbi:MAG: Ig-like domain-containing protein [Lachnospiraceae bacterium]|nr:Ig-like domain-containing protein [Lachnospiraceae bacterium]